MTTRFKIRNNRRITTRGIGREARTYQIIAAAAAVTPEIKILENWQEEQALQH